MQQFVPYFSPKSWLPILTFATVVYASWHSSAGAAEVRIKDLTTMQNVQPDYLQGIGLVVGLNGTGGDSPVTRQLFLNYLQQSTPRIDRVDRLDISKNVLRTVAPVSVTAKLPLFARKGSKVSVDVVQMDGESLEGGFLLLTSLRGVDGRSYATVKGPIVLGRFSPIGAPALDGDHHLTRGHVTGGATVVAQTPCRLGQGGSIGLLLKQNDFEAARRIAAAINKAYPGAARPNNDTRVDITVPIRHRMEPVEFLREIQMLQVASASPFVIDGVTGPIIAGRHGTVCESEFNNGNQTVITTASPKISSCILSLTLPPS